MFNVGRSNRFCACNDNGMQLHVLRYLTFKVKRFSRLQMQNQVHLFTDKLKCVKTM